MSVYISAKELQELIPQLSISVARNVIKEVREDMKKAGLKPVETKSLIAPTKLVAKKLGVREEELEREV